MSEILLSVVELIQRVLLIVELIVFAYCLSIVNRSSDRFCMLVCKNENKFERYCVFVEVPFGSMLLVYTYLFCFRPCKCMDFALFVFSPYCIVARFHMVHIPLFSVQKYLDI